METKSRIYLIVIAVLSGMLIASLCLNVFLLFPKEASDQNNHTDQKEKEMVSNESTASESQHIPVNPKSSPTYSVPPVSHFNQELVGLWTCNDNEIIINPDGSFVWTNYSIGEDKYIYECRRGYISDYVMIYTAKYFETQTDEIGHVTAKENKYYSAADIPEEEWESGKKTGGYQIIFHGETFGLKTDTEVTYYSFVKQ